MNSSNYSEPRTQTHIGALSFVLALIGFICVVVALLASSQLLSIVGACAIAAALGTHLGLRKNLR